VSGPLWKLRRLQAMSAGEVVHRARVAVRDRWFAPRWSRLTPAGAYHLLFRAKHGLFGGAGSRAPLERHAKDLVRGHRWLPGALDPAGAAAQAVRASARALEAGDWSLFGRAVKLGAQPVWNANPLTGARWPDAPSREIDYRDARAAGGAKFVHELGRLTFLPDLALAARLGDAQAGTRLVALLADWDAKNPLRHGVHYTSGIEMAVRCATGSAAIALLDGTPGADALGSELEPALGLLAQQALWCRDHTSVGSSANNHLLADAMAMTVMGGLWPSFRPAAKLLRAGRAIFAREIPRQFHADGVPAEQAFGYLPFIWELALLGLKAADAAGHELPAALRERLGASLEFARALRGPDGRAPQVGDEDDGRILLASLGGSRLDLVGNALAAWLGADALSDDAPAYAQLIGAAPAPARTAADGRHDFAEGGYTIWRERGLRVVFDHGPLGLGALAAHGHADALSITIARGADDLVVDPGTFAYHEDLAARDVSRGTPAHATVRFGRGSQSRMLGPFFWGRRAEVSPEGEGWRCRWASGQEHVRVVQVANGVVTLDDRVQGRGAELALPLAPGAVVRLEPGRASVDAGASRATITASGLADWRIEASEHAPRYGERVPAQRLVAAFSADHALTTIAIAAR